METKTVGIIGVNGKYGSYLKSFFGLRSCRVIGSDVGTKLSNQQIVEQTDVIIFAVPIESAVQVIEEMVPFSRVDQLWMDVTSLKGPTVTAMLRSQASVVGLHPMCVPPNTGETLRGQAIVRCDARLDDEWVQWVENFLFAIGARVKKSTPEEHDRYMAVVQGLPHAAHFIMAAVFRKLGINMTEILDYMSAFYRIDTSLTGRLLSQKHEMYLSIQAENPHIPMMLKSLHEETKHFRSVIGRKPKARARIFKADFLANKEHFGEKNVSEAKKLSDDIVRLSADLSEGNMLVVKTSKDEPGIAHRITGIFLKAQVNLTSFHSQKMGEGQFRFLVGFDKPKDSPEMQIVRDEIALIPNVVVEP